MQCPTKEAFHKRTPIALNHTFPRQYGKRLVGSRRTLVECFPFYRRQSRGALIFPPEFLNGSDRTQPCPPDHPVWILLPKLKAAFCTGSDPTFPLCSSNLFTLISLHPGSDFPPRPFFVHRIGTSLVLFDTTCRAHSQGVPQMRNFFVFLSQAGFGSSPRTPAK